MTPDSVVQPARHPVDASATGTRNLVRTWAGATLAAAAAISAFDALLLQRKKSFFTGGFLTDVHASGLRDATGFLATSALVDAGLIGLLAFALVCLSARVPLSRTGRFVLLAAGAALPPLVWAFLTYQLAAYLGDAFDLGLMFDLTGQSPAEILAVSSAHLVGPTLLIVAAGVLVAAVVWTIDRWAPVGSKARAGWPSRRLAGAAGALFVGALGVFGSVSWASELAEDGLRRKASGQFYMRLLEALTDFDRDGFGIGGRSGDPAPFDARIYPYALDVPANGIDENDVGGDLPSAVPAYVEGPGGHEPWRRQPNVVLFVLESFRADALTHEIDGKPVTPTLRALGREGISSARAYSHNGYTAQSRFHILTGSLTGQRSDGSLIDDFRAQGYQTAYFSGQDESFGGPEFGVGFERAEVRYDARRDPDRRYSTFTTAGSLAVSYRTLQERIFDFLATRDDSRPLFLYVNFHDTHFPYHHDEVEQIISNLKLAGGAIAPSRDRELRAMYFNTAANVDRAVGDTLQRLTSALGAPPAVIVTADHGESLFDEGFLGHGYALNDAQTRVPLIVRGLPMQIEEPFGQVDLRDAIRHAMTVGPDRNLPTIATSPDKRVFQYLGNVNRPRQIAMLDQTGRVIYDFRERSVTLPDGHRYPRRALPEGWRPSFISLVQAWERMTLTAPRP
jgi:hypothetical protein